MKAFPRQVTGSIPFKPFEIVLTFETREDVRMWTDIMSHNLSVPDMLIPMHNTASTDATAMATFMGLLNTAALEGDAL